MVSRLRSERGIALLAVLLGVAMLTLVVMDFTTTAALGYFSAANQANELRAYYLARSSINVGLALLAEDGRADAMTQNPIDTLADTWAIPYPPIPVDGGVAQVQIIDEARKINVNQVVSSGGTNQQQGQPNETYIEILTRLFQILGLDPQIVGEIVEWISPNSGGPNDTGFYMSLLPPYMPRYGAMPTIGDLKMIRGIDDPAFNLLRQFLTTYPETAVNANTAPPQVLMALTPQMMSNASLVKQIVQIRMAKPFQQVTDITNMIGGGTSSENLTKLLTVKSDYFTVAGMGTYAGARKLVYGTFSRGTGGSATLAAWQED